MRSVLAMCVTGVMLTAGCGSRQADTAEDVPTEQGSPASAEGRPAFRDRSSASADGTSVEEAVKTATTPTRKPSPFPSTATFGTSQPVPAEEPIPMEDAGSDAVAFEVRPEDLPEEGDEILVAPQFLGKLLPGINFEAVERRDPINVKSLLDQQGIVITNYQQLVEMGITNYQILRAPKPIVPAEQNAP